MKTGRYSIAQLLTSSEVEQIIIPELQRDYVWKERNVKGLLASILGNYRSKREQVLQIKDSQGNDIDNDILNHLNDEYMRLRYNTRVGFIYAYHDRSLSGQYYLIDGQQRITTIFLLLLALYRRSDADQFRKLYFVSSLPKIDYKVREVAHNFLVDFINYELTKKDDSTFKESSKYYSEYDKDVTARSIFSNYYSVIVPEVALYDDVESLIDYVENYIEFNYFDTNISEQGEKLYLYMNSRGESLSPQERVKSVIVGRSSDKLEAGRMWEDWQNFFWRIRPESDKNADRGFFEFLKWAVIIHVCMHQDSKIKKTINTEKARSRIEEIEDYIRIEKDGAKAGEQMNWICMYISENENFSFEWIQQVESAVERLCGLLQTPEFQVWKVAPNSWFSGCEETIEYAVLLGILHYLIRFKDSGATNVLRMAMYLKNLKSEYTLRRNPDRAVIRCIGLIGWLARNEINDVRLFGKYAKQISEGLGDQYVFRKDDLRWGYYLLDWQNAQNAHPQPDHIGQWESFFWKITNHEELNRFLRGNPDFIVRMMQKGVLEAGDYLKRFVEHVFNRRKEDSLRKDLMKYGDISVYDNGGSQNIGPNWMGRWCLLYSNSDEPYWNEFMNGKEAGHHASMVASYLMENQACMICDPIREALGCNLKYMNQKYYLRHVAEHQRMRIILLQDKQASETKARELCVQVLHRNIPGSWVWSYNCCVVNFVPTDHGLDTSIEDKNTGYYIDLWYEWKAVGGCWYCRFGHKERNLTDDLIRKVQESADRGLLGVECGWDRETSGGRVSLKTTIPVYTDKPEEDYFEGTLFVKSFFDKMWSLLIDLSQEGGLGNS